MTDFVPTAFRRGTVPLSDGRVLAYAEYGTADGSPVLFVPGAASGSLMAFGADAGSLAGVRLVAFDRPGLGGSDADPDKTFESVGTDAAELVGRLFGSPVPVVGNSQGAPFAIAAALAGAASRLVLVSPSDEVAFPAVHAQLPLEFRQLIERVLASPAEEAAKVFASFTPASFFEMVMADPSPSDRAVYQDAAFRERFRLVLEDGFAQGSAGYARDTALAMSPWSLDLEALDLPVHILFGEDDASHSPDLGRTLESRFPRATRTVIPGVGGSLLWARPDVVLDACLQD